MYSLVSDVGLTLECCDGDGDFGVDDEDDDDDDASVSARADGMSEAVLCVLHKTTTTMPIAIAANMMPARQAISTRQRREQLRLSEPDSRSLSSKSFEVNGGIDRGM